MRRRAGEQPAREQESTQLPEVPYREQDHGFADDSPMYPDYWPNGIGTAREREWWGSDEENEAEHADLQRREEARRRLGGFGFGNRTAAEIGEQELST